MNNKICFFDFDDTIFPNYHYLLYLNYDLTITKLTQKIDELFYNVCLKLIRNNYIICIISNGSKEHVLGKIQQYYYFINSLLNDNIIYLFTHEQNDPEPYIFIENGDILNRYVKLEKFINFIELYITENKNIELISVGDTDNDRIIFMIIKQLYNCIHKNIKMIEKPNINILFSEWIYINKNIDKIINHKNNIDKKMIYIPF